MKTNSDTSSPKVMFAEIQFGPEHVFAAPETLLWTFLFASDQSFRLRESRSLAFIRHCGLQGERSCQGKQNQEL